MSHRPRIQARSNRWWGHDDGCPQMTAHLKEHDEVPEECPIGRKRAHKTAPRELLTCTKGRGAHMLHARYSRVPTHRRPLARPHWCSTSATTLAGTPFTPRRGCATQFVAHGGVDQARTPMVRKRCTPMETTASHLEVAAVKHLHRPGPQGCHDAGSGLRTQPLEHAAGEELIAAGQ
jgi:hypothetical protein